MSGAARLSLTYYHLTWKTNFQLDMPVSSASTIQTGERVEDSQTGEEGRVRVNEIDPAVRPLRSFQIRAKRVPLSSEKPASMQ
ncbi:hypothetical protein KQX54_020621 [Cotesia glomerata]|uniref:Uncharacterized protein n=1 Tax=Cotesia glomerata TaxID=32391 RepID=A0AAV7I197_COTGL|nr:hypothetical protein KQX54_020621 [Cotesia glomerata]